MKVVNLTPHALHFLSQDNEEILVMPPSGDVARCAEIAEQVGTLSIEGQQIPMLAKKFGELHGLPSQADDTIYVVSAITAQAAFEQGRTDVFCPGDLVRGEGNVIIGCQSLCGNPIIRPAPGMD